MDKQRLIMQILNKTNRGLLRDKINLIESLLNTDFAAFYGYIEENLVRYFIKMIEDLKSKSKCDVLTIILHSHGGDNESMEMLYKAIFNYYTTLNVIIPDHVISTGTIFMFMADKIFLDRDKSAFSMIDPQVNNPYNNTQCSLFHEFSANGYTYKFDNSKNIKESLVITDPELKTPEAIMYSVQFSTKKEALLKSRAMCYDMLINHQFNNLDKKESEAVRFINYLMNLQTHLTHDFPIRIMDLEMDNFHFNYQLYTKDRNLNFAISDYDNCIRTIIGKSDDYYYETSGYGNYVNCMLQSKNCTII